MTRRSGRFVVLVAALLAACTPSPPAPPPAKPIPVPPPPPAHPPPRPVLHASWHFQPTQDTCRATAQAGRMTLAFSADHAGPIRLTVSALGHEPRLELRFAGPAGTWQIIGATAHGNAAVFSFGADDLALSRLLITLSGGTIDPVAPGLPLISLPESGAEGARWFACVRRALN